MYSNVDTQSKSENFLHFSEYKIVVVLTKQLSMLHLCMHMLNKITKMDILTLGDLTKAIEYENNKRNKNKISMILGTFP
jgi:hypothetical protein